MGLFSFRVRWLPYSVAITEAFGWIALNCLYLSMPSNSTLFRDLNFEIPRSGREATLANFPSLQCVSTDWKSGFNFMGVLFISPRQHALNGLYPEGPADALPGGVELYCRLWSSSRPLPWNLCLTASFCRGSEWFSLHATVDHNGALVRQKDTFAGDKIGNTKIHPISKHSCQKYERIKPSRIQLIQMDWWEIAKEENTKRVLHSNYVVLGRSRSTKFCIGFMSQVPVL
jgi:hypothetical protein